MLQKSNDATALGQRYLETLRKKKDSPLYSTSRTNLHYFLSTLLGDPLVQVSVPSKPIALRRTHHMSVGCKFPRPTSFL